MPTVATDHRQLGALLEASNGIPDDNSCPVDSWRNIQRVVPGHQRYIELRLSGTVDDYPGQTLQNVTDAVVTNINGLQADPQGWQPVEEPSP